MKYLLFLLSTFAVAFGCSSQARQAENASGADSAVVADVADSEYTDISKLRITPIGRYRSYYYVLPSVRGYHYGQYGLYVDDERQCSKL